MLCLARKRASGERKSHLTAHIFNANRRPPRGGRRIGENGRTHRNIMVEGAEKGFATFSKDFS